MSQTAWPSIRSFLEIPDELTGRGVRIAVVDGCFARHPDIVGTGRERAAVGADGTAEIRPAAVALEAGGAVHGLWVAAAAAGRGAEFPGAAPDAELDLVAAPHAGTAVRTGLEWLRANWRRRGLRAAMTAVMSRHDAGLLPWQTDPIRVLCEELSSGGLLVVAGTGNRPDAVCDVAQAASPSTLSVGGVVIPEGGGWEQAPPYHGGRGMTFAPAGNLPLPWGGAWAEHVHDRDDALPAGYARTEGTSIAGPIVLGIAACLWQAHPDWTAAQIRQALRVTSRRRERWQSLRAGLVDVGLAARIPSLPPAPRAPSPFDRHRRLAEAAVGPRLARIPDEEEGAAVELVLSFLPGPVPGAALSCAETLLRHPAPRVRAAALCLLATRPDVGAAVVAEALGDGDPRVRAAALHVLEGRGWAEAVTRRVVDLLDDEVPGVSRMAAKTLAGRGVEAAVPALVLGLGRVVERRWLATYATRIDALGRLTGERFEADPEWRPGMCPMDDGLWRARSMIAGRWRDWLARNGPGSS